MRETTRAAGTAMLRTRSSSVNRATAPPCTPIVMVHHADDIRNDFTSEVVPPPLVANKNNVLRDGALTPSRLTAGKVTPSGRKSNVGFEVVRHDGEVVEDDVSERGSSRASSRGSEPSFMPVRLDGTQPSGQLFRKSAHYEVKLNN